MDTPQVTEPQSSSMSDDEIMAIITAEQASLERYIRTLVRDPDEAADIGQDVAIRLLLAARAGKTPDNPGAWMRRVAHNAVVSAARHRAVVQRSADRLVDRGEHPSPEEAAIHRERDLAIAQSLREARPDDRTAMILAAQGFEAGEIGAALGRTALATRVLLCRARGRMRAQMAVEAF